MARTWKFCKPVVLASASPRRLALLSEVADDITVLPSDVDESRVTASSPRALVRELSRLKALSVAERLNGGDVVIGADTVVYLDKLYGKPRDRADAIRMLSELNGKEHYVFTGVTVVADGGVRTFSVRSAVRFRSLAKEEIERYVDEYRPYDKAGAYAVQEGVVVGSYKGSLSNIIGLPIEKLVKVLKEVQSGSDRIIR
ncbi:MAG: Maf family protein [Christensenellales bacterium]|nr:Maf family protein [Christensenellales bacterium]